MRERRRVSKESGSGDERKRRESRHLAKLMKEAWTVWCVSTDLGLFWLSIVFTVTRRAGEKWNRNRWLVSVLDMLGVRDRFNPFLFYESVDECVKYAWERFENDIRRLEIDEPIRMSFFVATSTGLFPLNGRDEIFQTKRFALDRDVRSSIVQYTVKYYIDEFPACRAVFTVVLEAGNSSILLDERTFWSFDFFFL